MWPSPSSSAWSVWGSSRSSTGSSTGCIPRVAASCGPGSGGMLCWPASLPSPSACCCSPWLTGFVIGYGLLLCCPGAASRMPFARLARRCSPSIRLQEGHGGERRRLPGGCLGTGHRRPSRIAYLPTLYAAYNRRETEVTLLGPRAGSPAWGPELLAQSADGARHRGADGRHQAGTLVGGCGRVPFELPVASSFPLTRTASVMGSFATGRPRRRRAAHGGLPGQRTVHARLCVQMGFTCLRS